MVFLSDNSASNWNLSANTNQLCPLLKETLHNLEQTKKNDELSRFKWILKLLRDSEEAHLAESLSPDELEGSIELLLDHISRFTETGEPQIGIHNTVPDNNPLPFTMVSIVLPKLPFIVDSSVEWLSGESIETHHLFHGALSSELFDNSVGFERSPFLITLFIEKQSRDSIKQLTRDLENLTDDLLASVEDSPDMLEKTRELRDQITQNPSESPPIHNNSEVIKDFLNYLMDDHFVFLGYFQTRDRDKKTYPSRLGLCRAELDMDLTAVDPTRSDHENPPLLEFYKTNLESRVYRRECLDAVILNKPDQTERTHVFLGLLTNRVLSEPAVQIPLLHEKFETIVDRQELSEHTHSYRDYYTIYNSMPKDLLLMSDVENIIEDLTSILSVRGERTFKLRARPTSLQQGLSVMILMEQDRFSGEVRKKMQSALEEELEAHSINYQLSLGTGGLARLHFDLITDHLRPEDITYEDLEDRLFNMTRTWDDHFRSELRDRHEHDRVQELFDRYSEGFGDEYRASVRPHQAVRDAEKLDELLNHPERAPLVDFATKNQTDETRLVLFHSEKLSLNETLPILSNHGFQVEEQSTFTVQAEESEIHLHLFQLTDNSGNQLDLSEKDALISSLRGVLRGWYRNDELNTLVHQESLSARMVNVLRLYKNYFHQLVPAIKMETINRTLVRYPQYSSRLVKFFEAKFDPDKEFEDRSRIVREHRNSIAEDLEEISERTPYQILRQMLDFLETTVRTNYFQTDYPEANFETPETFNENHKSYISVKIASGQLTERVESSVQFEIFVYSPLMEAVHLRSGEIARGGIRWSNRRDDYRTEIADLMETQQKKNALIVPVGAKGGFILKEEYLPNDSSLGEQARIQYTTFMRGLLDLTDNVVKGEVVTPPNLVTYDGDDPYLVVAADKGTATFSDLANSIARKYDFWLDDAFASGGSKGYDHKEVGITARGGWECVKRHFRELGRDISSEPFTVSGIGDMGGDVFGNGMILSDRIRLVAAFNHRHIFLDPDPDPEQSFSERKRLFEADQSGWNYYNTDYLSEGGGIYDRNASIITLEDPALDLLNLDTKQVAPDKVIRAILTANVDLLWNGGIGTYIKSSEESNAEVEDPQNDPFRVNSNQVRADIIGEGGNLGITQPGRVELAQNGVKLNTDFIDNSGGVDLSDREVNLKILLQKSIELDEIEQKERDGYLEEYEGHAINGVLNDNYRQSATISLEVLHSDQNLEDVRSLLHALEADGYLDRSREHLPDDQALDDRKRAGEGLTRPEASILLSVVKQALYRESLKDSWPETTILKPFLKQYLPNQAPKSLSQGVDNHHLKKNIALTELVNYAVDSVGYTFFYRLRDQLGTDLKNVLKAFQTADYFSEGMKIRKKIFQQDDKLDANVQYEAWSTLTDRVGHLVSWLIDTINESIVYEGFQNRMRDALSERFETVRETLRPPQDEYYQQIREKWVEKGFPSELGHQLARVSYLVPALEVILVHQNQEDREFRELSETYFELGQLLNVDWIIRQVYERESMSRWDELAFRSLGVEAHNIQRELLNRIIQSGQSLDQFLKQHKNKIQRLNELQYKLAQEETSDFSAYQYMLQRIRSLI